MNQESPRVHAPGVSSCTAYHLFRSRGALGRVPRRTQALPFLYRYSCIKLWRSRSPIGQSLDIGRASSAIGCAAQKI
ncbi:MULTISPECIES: hypothetical protein [unclassified Microcoleus]|uniref:hypothetical protein n=1 Tax=unclassified Microcoleus TaxID=2642155 RepID=UPI002FD77D15